MKMNITMMTNLLQNIFIKPLNITLLIKSTVNFNLLNKSIEKKLQRY